MASTFVDEAIAANKVVMFSKSSCPFCSKAKSALKSVGADFKVYEIERRPGFYFPLSKPLQGSLLSTSVLPQRVFKL